VQLENVLKDVVSPRDLRPGASLFHNGKPYTIQSVEHIKEPWTGRNARAVRIDDETRLVFLVLICDWCDATVAAPYNTRMSELEWVEIRYRGELYWLCNNCLQESTFPGCHLDRIHLRKENANS
jgi:hypothetical protein